MFDINSFSVVPTTSEPQKTNTESIYVMSNDRYSNLGQMENFPASKETIGDGVLAVSYNFDYTQVPTNYDTKSFWEELSEPVSEAGGYVWDTAKGTWESVKESAAGVGTSVLNAVDSAGNKIVEGYKGVLDTLRENLLYAVLILLVVIWVVAKSGILKDVLGILLVAK